jgi:hypothetical protein
MRSSSALRECGAAPNSADPKSFRALSPIASLWDVRRLGAVAPSRGPTLPGNGGKPVGDEHCPELHTCRYRACYLKLNSVATISVATMLGLSLTDFEESDYTKKARPKSRFSMDYLLKRRLQNHEHPVVLPHVSHFMQVPLRTSEKWPHSPHISPS